MPSGDRLRQRPRRLLAAALLALAACGDLLPSGTDRRPHHEAGSVGSAVGQTAPDFTLPDVQGNPVSLHESLATARGAILYFTMWCPVCDAHMISIERNAVPAFPEVRYFALDYVSGTPAEARAAQVAAGWDGSDFTVLSDAGAAIEAFYSAPMGIVVVDRDRVIRMNGEYDWNRLEAVLTALPSLPPSPP